MRPYSVVEDEGFADWIGAISSGRYRPPCRKTMTAMTPELFLALEDHVCNLFLL